MERESSVALKAVDKGRGEKRNTAVKFSKKERSAKIVSF